MFENAEAAERFRFTRGLPSLLDVDRSKHSSSTLSDVWVFCLRLSWYMLMACLSPPVGRRFLNAPVTISPCVFPPYLLELGVLGVEGLDSES